MAAPVVLRQTAQPKKKLKDPSWTPFSAAPPPSGLYDPALDAQVGSADRGLLDLLQDVGDPGGTRPSERFGTQGLRDISDYGLARDALQRGQSRGMEDIGARRTSLQQGFDRSSQDLTTSGDRAQQDYDRNVSLLGRRYAVLGDQQRQQQSHAGVMRGGAMLQAEAKRAANQGLERQPLDTGLQRTQSDIEQQRTRLGEDLQTETGQLDLSQRRLDEDTQLQLGDLALKAAPPDESNPLGGRSFQDRITQATRAQRENAQFGLDASKVKAYEAGGAGWMPAQMPSNEFVDPSGQHRRLVRRGNTTVAIDPTGRELWRRKAA